MRSSKGVAVDAAPFEPAADLSTWIYRAVYLVAFLLFFGWGTSTIIRLSQEHRKGQAFYKRTRMTFSAFMSYRFEYWFTNNDNANAIVLGVIAAGTLLLGALLYCVIVGEGLASSTWGTFVQLVAPDGGAGEETVNGKVVCGALSVCGLVIFALLLTLLQDSFTSWLESHKLGLTQVIESDHIVLVGLQPSTFPVLEELCMAHEASGGITIAILSTEYTKEEMEMNIDETCPDLDPRGSRIVVRAGNRHMETNLKHVAADTARTVVIFPDMNLIKEERDASVLRTVIALRGSGWPMKGRILAMCSLKRNLEVIQQMGGSVTDVVTTNVFVSQLMVQGSREWGLGRVIHQAFGWEGVKFCIREIPEQLKGKTFLEASYHYKQAVLVGVMQKSVDERDSCRLCPETGYKLQAQDELVLLCSDLQALDALDAPIVTVSELVKEEDKQFKSSGARKETIIFLGWNDLIARLLFELDPRVGEGTTVLIVAPTDSDHRIQHLEKESLRFATALTNIVSIIHVEANLGSNFMLAELPVSLENCDRIFLLSDENAPTPMHADTVTLTMLMQVREHIIKQRRDSKENKSSSAAKLGHCTIVPEIQTPECKKHCTGIHASDYIDTAGMTSQIIGMAAWEPRIMTVLESIISEEGTAKIGTRRLERFTQQQFTSINWCEAQNLVAATGGVLIGWSLLEPPPRKDKSSDGFRAKMMERLKEANPDAEDLRWQLGPGDTDKLEQRPWDMNRDKLVLLYPKGARQLRGKVPVPSAVAAGPGSQNALRAQQTVHDIMAAEA